MGRGDMKTRIVVLSAAAVSAFLLGGGIAQAGNPSGFTATILATGTIANATEIQANGIRFSSPPNAQVIVQQGDFVAGGTTGWHMHPGLTVVTVTNGTLRFHNKCSVTVYTKGESFVEPPNTPVTVKNESASVPAQVITTLVVPAGMAPRTNVSPPHCT